MVFTMFKQEIVLTRSSRPALGVKRPGRDVHHSPSSSAALKNERSYTSVSSVWHGRRQIYLSHV